MVELVTGLLFVAIGVRFGLSLALLPFLVFTAVVVALTGIDIDTLTLPRQLVYGGAVAGAVLLTMSALAEGEPGRLIGAAVGAAIATAALLALHELSPRAMGFGDVRFAGLIGLHLGWLGVAQVPAGLVLAFVLGAVGGIGFLAGCGAAGWRTRIPFGPFRRRAGTRSPPAPSSTPSRCLGCHAPTLHAWPSGAVQARRSRQAGTGVHRPESQPARRAALPATSRG